MLLVVSVLSGLVWAGFGKMGVEKLLTALVMPVGFLWLLMTAWMLLSWFQRRIGQRAWATAAWIILTLLSTGPLPNAWVNYLESQVPEYQPDEGPPLDFLVVLGGGTRSGPTRAEAGYSGDRVLYAAQLYIQGHCRHLITTGTSGPKLGRGEWPDPTEQTEEIWTALGIDRSAISALPGRNTYEEIQSLKKIMPEMEGKRIGILTSASHLPRALRLAEAAGISGLIPVAANHNGGEFTRALGHFLPSAQHLSRFAACQHEWMGSLVGR